MDCAAAGFGDRSSTRLELRHDVPQREPFLRVHLDWYSGFDLAAELLSKVQKWKVNGNHALASLSSLQKIRYIYVFFFNGMAESHSRD